MTLPLIRTRIGPAAALLLATACVSLDDNTTGPGSVNTPVVGAAGQGVSFTVSARGFTFDQTYQGPAAGDSIAVGLVVSGYGGGSALVEIVDGNTAKQLSLPVTGNLVQGQSTEVHGTPPYQLHVKFTNFTGVFVLGVGV